MKLIVQSPFCLLSPCFIWRFFWEFSYFDAISSLSNLLNPKVSSLHYWPVFMSYKLWFWSLKYISVWKCTGFSELDWKPRPTLQIRMCFHDCGDTNFGFLLVNVTTWRRIQTFVVFHFCSERRKMVTTCSPWWWGSPVAPPAPEVWSEP